MKVLSLFDGMACGMLAMKSAGVDVESYDAFEIDRYAIDVAKHNFPMIEHHGDVFEADFTQFEGVDAVIGGSPCTHWSIAQTKNRETEAHGIGWELFQQYVRAIREAKPRFFIYENNKSMADAIKQEISATFGFGPHLINSSRVSAQNRQRYYWVGIRQEDGTYRQCPVEQPVDRGILLRDVLDEGWTIDREKSHAVLASMGRTTHREYFQKSQGQMCATPLSERELVDPIRVGELPGADGKPSKAQAMRVYSQDGKSVGLKANGGGLGAKTGLYAIPTDTTYDKPAYTVKDGMIQIKGREFPIRLPDGYYIIRKLTVDECERLQTVPNVKESVMFNLIDDSVEVEKWFIEHQSNRAQSVGEKCHKSQKLAENVENTDLLGFVQCAVNNSSTKLLQIKEPAQLNVHISSEVVSNPKGYFAELKKNVSTVARHSDCPIAEQIDVFVQAIAGISMLLERTAPLGKVDVLLNGRSIATLMNGKMSSNISGKEMRELVNSVDINANTVMKTITSITSDPGQDIQNIDQTLIILYSYVKNVIGSSTLSRMWTSISFTIERRYTAPVSNTQAYKCLGNGWTVEVIAHLIRSVLDEAKL